MKDVFSKVREYGLAIVFAEQISSEVSQFAFSNIGTLVMFRHSDGRDLQRVRYSSGATLEQSLANYSLKVGEAVVRSMRCKDLHRITVPFEPADKFIPRQEVEDIMRPRLRGFHADVIPATPRQSRDGVSCSDVAPALSETEHRFIECLIQDFERPVHEVYQELGIGSSAGYRLKKRLLDRRYISQIETNLWTSRKTGRTCDPRGRGA